MNEIIALYTTLGLMLVAGPPASQGGVRAAPTGIQAEAPAAAAAVTAPAPDTGSGVEEAVWAEPPGAGEASATGQEALASDASRRASTTLDDFRRFPTVQEAVIDSILRRTSAAYEAMDAVATDFEQVLRNDLLGRTTRSAGRLYQQEPDKFLMDFSDPEGDLIVSDGEYFWMYFPSVDEEQVIRTPRGGRGLDLQAQFIGDIVNRFDATYHGTEEVWGRTAHVMTLEPRPDLGYRQLKVWIDDQDNLVRRFEITEENGNVRRMLLRDMEVNPELPAELFEFTPPPGTFVVEQG